MNDMVLERAPQQAARLRIIDCDIHPVPRSLKALHPYLAQRLARCAGHVRHPRLPAIRRQLPLSEIHPRFIPPGQLAAERRTAGFGRRLPARAAPGSAGYRDRHPAGAVFPSAKDQRDLRLGAAMATALNDWQIAEWCEPEPRLRASIVVAFNDPDSSVAEIHRRAGDRRFASVFLTPRASEPLGRKRYWPSTRRPQPPGCRSASTPAASTASRSRRADHPACISRITRSTPWPCSRR